MFVFCRFLSRSLAQATLTLLEKIFCLKLLFIAIQRGALKGSTIAILCIFIGTIQQVRHLGKGRE